MLRTSCQIEWDYVFNHKKLPGILQGRGVTVVFYCTTTKKCQHKYNSLKKGGVADKEKQVTPVLEQGETGVFRDVVTCCKVKVEF